MFKDKFSNIILNKYPLKNIDKIENYKQKKFILKILENFEERNKTINNNNNNINIINNNNNNNKKYFREYKFKCNNEKEKTSWVTAITKAIKKYKTEVNIQSVQKIELKEYKKIINDFFNLPNIKIDEPYMRIKVLDSLINEDYFGIIPSKIKAIKKSVKKIKDEKEKNDKKSVGNKIKNWFTSGFNNSGKNNK